MARSMPFAKKLRNRASAWMRLSLLGLLALWSSACSGGGDEDDETGQSPSITEPSVEVGTPGGDDGLAFIPLEPGGTLYIETFGQGGTHVLFAIRCNGFGNRAFVNVSLTNLETGVEVSTPDTSRPQLLVCHDERSCDLVPLLVMMGGIAEPGADRDGLRVRVAVEAHNVDGDRAEVETEGVLSTELL
jgi:hypothetical protein